MNMNNSEKNKNKTDGRRSQLVVFMLFWNFIVVAAQVLSASDAVGMEATQIWIWRRFVH